MLPSSPKILLSFDVEEFDLPLEYGQPISKEHQLQMGFRGLHELHEILQAPHVAATLFTTAFFAGHYPAEISALAARHEIASHTYFHTTFEEKDLKKSKEKLEAITGQTIYGLRMPRMKTVPASSVLAAGYQYNSSINPTWLPGRYNNLNVSRQPFSEQGLLQFPVSVTPRWRIPLFWLAFKNLPLGIFLTLVRQTLQQDGYVCLYFHPWEFVDLSAYRLPFYIKRGSNKKLLQRLARLIHHLHNEAEFQTMKQFIDEQYSVNAGS